MRGLALALLTGLFALAATDALAVEAPKKDPGAKVGEKKPVDEYRSITAQLAAARKRAIQEVPDLKAMDDEIRAKMKEVAKMRDELYKKIAAASPTVAELEKKKAALDAERKRKRDEERKARGAKRGKRARKDKAPEKM